MQSLLQEFPSRARLEASHVLRLPGIRTTRARFDHCAVKDRRACRDLADYAHVDLSD